MFKLLFILAAAFALAAAANSTPLEFQHLEESDADLLFSDVADDLDLNDELEDSSQNSEVDTDDEQREVGVTNDEDGSIICPVGYKNTQNRCEQCLDQETTSYGQQDGNVCTPCDEGYKLDQSTRVCNNDKLEQQTIAQQELVKGLKDIGMLHTLEQIGYPTIVQDFRETNDLNNAVIAKFGLNANQAQVVGQQLNTVPPHNHKKPNAEVHNVLSHALQTTSCPVGKTCCLQGWYGDHPNCVQCPSNKPSSPRTASGGPDSNCNCPNAAASSCFACRNVCRPFNVATGICTPICSTCKVRKIGGVKTPTNC